jgi:hypothetical protein
MPQRVGIEDSEVGGEIEHLKSSRTGNPQDRSKKFQKAGVPGDDAPNRPRAQLKAAHGKTHLHIPGCKREQKVNVTHCLSVGNVIGRESEASNHCLFSAREKECKQLRTIVKGRIPECRKHPEFKNASSYGQLSKAGSQNGVTTRT